MRDEGVKRLFRRVFDSFSPFASREREQAASLGARSVHRRQAGTGRAGRPIVRFVLCFMMRNADRHARDEGAFAGNESSVIDSFFARARLEN